MSWMFKLRGELNALQSMVLAIIGFLLILIIWIILTSGAHPILEPGILPHPWKVLTAFGDLYHDNDLIKNTFYSIGLNLSGYMKAIMTSVVIGFLIGLYPVIRGMFQSHIDAIRFIPLSAVTGIFITWFGIGSGMKVNFLAFGIMIYLLPVVVQRIDEVKDVYLKTVYTLGATNWQTIKSVYFPSVFSRLFDDVRILTAISWTYIILAEMIASQGGIGYLLFAGRRQGRVDKRFALLLLIILIGIIQDRVFRNLDKEFFPYKYQTKDKYSKEIKKPSLVDTTLDFIFSASVWIIIFMYFIFAIAEFTMILGGIRPLSYLFQDSIWAIHLIFILILIYKGRKLYNRKVNVNSAK